MGAGRAVRGPRAWGRAREHGHRRVTCKLARNVGHAVGRGAGMRGGARGGT
jgi:hypothetical protein